MSQTRVNVHQFSLETTSPEVDKLENPKSISLVFFPGKWMCKETTRTFKNKKNIMHVQRSCIIHGINQEWWI